MTRLFSTRTTLLLLLALTALLYAVNFHVNDIWTENESFYADAARRMVESGDWLTISYNGEARFNKPPLTYWLIAASTSLFGMNEFAIRLPVMLMAFWTVLLTWSMARMLYGPKAALYAFALQAIGIQFIAGKQYASPEIPLAFFFTLTLWLFLKGEKSGNGWYYTASATALGLTVLTKGYPYLVVIGGIIATYILLDSRLNPKTSLRKLRAIRPVSGALIALTIGLGWVAWMALHYGDAFMAVLKDETMDRAFSYKADLLEDLLFYPYVILWGFFPYSLTFFLALLTLVRQPRKIPEHAFPFAWFIVMLIIFTIAKGKIPTYFIQAHPAMALLAAWAMSGAEGSGRKGFAWNTALLLPSLLSLAAAVAMVAIFDLPYAYYAIPATALALLLWAYRTGNGEMRPETLNFAPFITTFSALLILAMAIMPSLETWRRIDTIEPVVIDRLHIPQEVPLYVETGPIYNLPFYAKRNVIYFNDPTRLPWNERPLLVMMRSTELPDSLGASAIWQGPVYTYRSSESRMLIFIRSVMKAKRGDTGAFTDYTLIHHP